MASSAPRPAAAPAPPPLLPEDVTLPDLDQAALLLRYEAHIERQLARAYNLRQRVQCRRRRPLARGEK